MTLEERKTYTDSGLSDLIKLFFNRFKENGSYKYTSLIDNAIIQSKVIEINFNDCFDEIQLVLQKEKLERIHTAIYRAIGEVFQTRHGSTELDGVKNEDMIKFKIINSEIIEDKVFSNPKLVHYAKYNPEDYEGEQKIDNVAQELQRANRFVTIRNTEEILLYNGKIYDNLQAETIIKEKTENLIPNCTTHDRREVINKIKAQTYSDLEKFDTDPNLITVENGILNLETLELEPHNPNHLSRVLLPVEYNKPEFENIEDNLKDTLFWKYLKNSFTVNGKFQQKEFETVLEVIASPIIKRHVDEKAFMFLGGGENGKSVCLSYIQSLIGKDNVSNIALQDIAEDKFLRANLVGKSANIFPDLEQNELRHTGKVKAITSNEGIEVQKKHQQGFTLYPFCKLLFSCNRFPKVFDQSQGFFRRWIIVKWERDFENDPERIEYLKEKLEENQEEKNLVFSSLVVIANRLNKYGKLTYSKNWREIQKEWNENADPIDDFATNYIFDSEKHKSKRETYHYYKKVMIEKGQIPKGIGQFGKAFAEYYEEDRIEIEGRTQRAWLNIDFKIPKQETLSTIDTTKPKISIFSQN
ncbi:MAG: phage/plasmid primase, P4 family [Nitrosopumilus sp.]|nr:phage/plasmid primase, P4 family [Nitrosopumilus sp.]MDF2428407.1 phage/plasmid primase, P4 family [Nitrosopumilus sp.]MDF2429879.1 phage/plasmid primase, P4 family [Nitrosopumilus sp.]